MKKNNHGKVEIGRVGVPKIGFTQIRCDRNVGSIFSNIYKIKDGCTRDDCCDLYDRYFIKEIGTNTKLRVATKRLLRKLKCGENILLQCHCTPKRCHTNTIKNYLEKELLNG